MQERTKALANEKKMFIWPPNFEFRMYCACNAQEH